MKIRETLFFKNFIHFDEFYKDKKNHEKFVKLCLHSSYKVSTKLVKVVKICLHSAELHSF